MISRLAAALLAAFALAASAFAHGDLHAQIDTVSAQLRAKPDDADLYLKRAELYRLHKDWPAAAADYDRAAHLAPALHAVHLGRGRMHFACGRFDEAKAELDAFLAANPGHVEAHVTSARIDAKRANHFAAADGFARAIALSPHPEPDFYIERAQALTAAGDAHLDDALRCLEDGTAKLGNLPTFGLPAVALEVRQRRFDAALARLDQLSAASARKEAWIERRGDVLTQAGRIEEAQQAYRTARDAILKLSERLRGTKATRDLDERLKTKISAHPPSARQTLIGETP